jgi:4-amino-4-deoxy-L-arabinose transferase-like glycosyltransferase
MSIAVVITVFAGFAPTYYLRPYYTTAPLMPLLHLHGLVFTSWLVLFVTQTTLVAAHRTDIHRRLGIVGGVIAVLMILVGFTTAVIRAKQGATPVPEISPLSFLVVPLGDISVFAILIGAGFYYRRRPDVHNRRLCYDPRCECGLEVRVSVSRRRIGLWHVARARRYCGCRGIRIRLARCRDAHA